MAKTTRAGTPDGPKPEQPEKPGQTGARPGIGRLEDWSVPELFADELAGSFVSDGCIHLTLAVKRSEHAPGAAPAVKAVTCGRVVLTLKGAAQLRDQLNLVFASLEKRGVVRNAPAPAKPPPQAPSSDKVN